MTDTLARRLAEIEERKLLAAQRASRHNEDVTLVAVSKTFDADVIREAHSLGVRHFGESYLQEWQSKVDVLPEDIKWHFIGHVQSNKIKHFDGRLHLVHAVDRASVIKAMKKEDAHQHDILLQINVGGEAQKSGADPAQLEALLERCVNIPNIKIHGLMTVPPYHDDAEESRPYFVALQRLLDRARTWLDRHELLLEHPCDQLSMGMSGDFEVAIEEGATLIRVGSALFGERDYS